MKPSNNITLIARKWETTENTVRGNSTCNYNTIHFATTFLLSMWNEDMSPHVYLCTCPG